jgi:uncharacterized protein (DUF362 family)/NAD-dependent dihydropyrimidine dehydrogenase PreA subunit
MSKVLILDCPDYESVEGKIGEIFKEFPKDWRGKKVLVKPNMLNSRPPEQGCDTHPAVVKAVTKWLLDAGAQVTVGDNPGTFGKSSNEECAKGSGIADASLGCYRNIGQDAVNLDIKSRFVKQVTVSRAVLDADIIVSLPKFKTHSLTQITGAIKNMFGILVGGDKSRMHGISGTYKNFSELLLDIYQIRMPDIIIMDAVVGMEGNGPTSGKLRQIGKIIASTDGVAVDAVMTTMMGKHPEKIHILKLSRDRGVGEINLSKMNIIGEIKELKNFQLPSTFLCQIAGRLGNNQVFRYFMERRPVVLDDKCKGCGVCAENCPVSGISLIDKIPVINRKTCIRCYCCQELCPNDAVELRQAWAGKK